MLLDFLTTYGGPPRTVNSMNMWLLHLVAALAQVASICYNEDVNDPVPADLNALWPDGKDNAIVLWKNTTNGASTLYFYLDDDWRDGPSTAGAYANIPPAMMQPYAGDATAAAALAPDWLICDGSAVSRVTYADLFAVIGTDFGSGDGFSTFNLPDLRGRVVAGLDNMGGSSADVVTDAAADTIGGEVGEEDHTLSVDELPAHHHTMDDYNAANSPNVTWSGGSYPAPRIQSAYTDDTEDTGGDQAHNNIQPSTFMHWMIKT